MHNRIIYGIIKTYQGVFVKKHIGNVQIFIIELNDTFMILNILGIMEDDKLCAQMLLKAPIKYIDSFINQFEEGDNFIQLEELFCTVPKENNEEFKVILKKKGKYLHSNYTFNFSNEYSQGNIKIYLIEGKFTPLTIDSVSNNTQMKMKALKSQAIAKPLLTKFIASLKR